LASLVGRLSQLTRSSLNVTPYFVSLIIFTSV